MDSKTFLDLLRQSRLLSDQQVAEIARRFGGSDSTQAVATSLVADGVLTPFQARRLTAGQIKGLVLGQYKVLDELGAGGFGQVFRALHTVMGRVVAVKVIAPQLIEDPRARTYFRREVLAATQLCHPNIVMAYDANEADGLLFLVMECVEGADLETAVRAEGPLAVSTAYEMMRQAGQALQYAHERGLVHRDIKPANLLIPRAGGPVAVKVVDFGLARLRGPAATNTHQTQGEQGFLGTPDYVSPEQARNAGAADIRSDLYSLGCTFYFALAGRKPFRGESALETLVKHLEEDPEPLEALRPEVPAGMASVVRRLMAKDPGRRFQTPAQLVAELDFLAGRDVAARPLVSPAAPPRPFPFPRKGPVTPPKPSPFPAPPRVTPVPPGEPGRVTAPQPGAMSEAGATMAVAVTPVRAEAASFPEVGWAAPSVATPMPLPTPAELTADVPAPEPTAGVPAGAVGGAPTPSPTPAAPGRAGGPAFRAAPVRASAGRLRAAWREWRAVVEAFAGGTEPEVDEAAYAALHRELLAACRAGADGADRDEALRALEAVVEPWVTPQALADAGREALAGLLARGLQIEAELFGPGRPSALPSWAALVAAAVLAAAVGIYVLGPGAWSRPGIPSGSSVLSVVRANPVVSTAAAVSVVLLASLCWLSRPLRR